MIEPHTTPPRSAFQVTPQLILGILIICVGVIFTLDELGYAPAISFLKFWPLALIAIGVTKMLAARDGGGAFAGLIFTLVGVWLQGEELNLIHINLRNAWPVALVLFGGYLVWQGLMNREMPRSPASAPPVDVPPFATRESEPARPNNRQTEPIPNPHLIDAKTRVTDTNSRMSAMAILGAVSRGNNSSTFRRADLLAIMGGCEIDLRKAAINGEAIIDVFAMWGGIEIRVPEDWTVVSRVVPLMGGVEDKTRPPQTATAHRLVLRGFAIMGGIEIKN
jgi:predicted membrane protein